MPKALLVTDSEWVRNDVSAALSLDGWLIHDLDDPDNVVRRVREIGPDVLIADMQVKSMGGMAVIRAVRGEIEPEHRPKTVLLLDRSADVFLAGRAGADAHLLKPFTAQDLRAVMAGWMDSFEKEPRVTTSTDRSVRKRANPRRKEAREPASP